MPSKMQNQDKIQMQDQEQVWDEIAHLWNKNKTMPLGAKDSIIKDFISVEKDKKILDLGCGSGRNFIALKEAGFKGVIYGVDFSENMLKHAKENAKKFGIKVVLKKANVWETGFEDNSFDKAIFIATLHCVETSEQREQAIKELYRVLKPKGKAIITAWNKNAKRWKNKPKEKIVSWKLDENTGKKVNRYYYLYNQEELIKELENAGFKIIKKNREEARNIVLEVGK
ncbi:methyltransferase domain-containing protein [Candidatus Pacearchaeota archaeon]|nr:methyltransferase domain-containing protein [Candidatus Pacearchaeota archaeon]